MTERLYIEPIGLARRTAGEALPLAGGPLRFTGATLAWREGGAARREERGIGDLPHGETETLRRLTDPRERFAGVEMDRPQVMGIVNVTPDSFSDGGDRFDGERAIADGLAMWQAGAAFIDVGGESTRPGADPVPPEEEVRRVVPVVRALAEAGVRVSIDSRRASVMAAAVEAGAAVINDVTALGDDPEALPVAAALGVPVILMHMQGEPRTMQQDPRYDDVALDVYDFLAGRVAACEAAGIPRARLCVDPGIGFGKTLQHNLELLDRLALLHGLGCPLLLGASRKSFLGRVAGVPVAKDRLPGSIAVALAGVARGVQILRVHDVAETLQALALWQAVGEASFELP